jgi:glycosyltransferase involved in cell wall biosynthesis
VVFAGERHGDELAHLYAGADLFVLPSACDTFGLVVVEAQASGVPVVVTDMGGPRELIVPDKTGVVVPFGDPAALAEAIAALAADPARRQEMGRRARDHVADFSFDRAVNEMFQAYPSLPHQHRIA